jgi:hypothetical protein
MNFTVAPLESRAGLTAWVWPPLPEMFVRHIWLISTEKFGWNGNNQMFCCVNPKWPSKQLFNVHAHQLYLCANFFWKQRMHYWDKNIRNILYLNNLIRFITYYAQMDGMKLSEKNIIFY